MGFQTGRFWGSWEPPKLAAGCIQLSSLNLGCCFKVTDMGVAKLAAGCPQLSLLNLVECYKVTDKGVKRLRAALPGCEIVGYHKPYL